MRHLSVIVLLFICLTVYGQAGATTLRDDQKQQQQDRKERKGERGPRTPDGVARIRLIKAAYITKRLELTPAQSEKFWPLYNKYLEDMAAVQKQIRQNNSPSQTNGKDQVLNELALDEKKNSTKKYYTNEFLKILPFEKVSLIFKSEKDFNDEVIKKMREQKGDANN
jgi:hypothetical protein